jgi:adenylate kinase
VIVLEAKDDVLERKAALTSDDREKFRKELRKYRRHNKDEANIFNFFDDRAIPSLVCDAFGEIDNVVFDFLGPKRDFGRPPEEIEAERLEAERVVKEKEEAETKQKEEALVEQSDKWAEGDGIHALSVARLEAEDEDFLAGTAKVLEDYLDGAVLKQVAEGILEIAQTRPENPIDELAKFLFAEHRKQKRYQ